MTAMRELNTRTLDQAAIDMAANWFRPTIWSPRNKGVALAGRDWTLQTFYNADFKDEHEYLLERFRRQLGVDPLEEFDRAAAEMFTPRDDAVFEQLLAEKLAINPAGEHIKGRVGSVQIGSRIVGLKTIECETPASVRYRKKHGLGKNQYRETETRIISNQVPIHAGEPEENQFMGLRDMLRDQSGAFVFNMSAATAILALDALADDLDSGTSNGVIQGRSGAQPVDPDAATTGVLLFTLPLSDPAFLGASDQADGTVDASASTITDDSSADATNTLGYCRASSTNDGSTPLDEKIDGQAGTSGSDFVFNTLSIVSGAVISMSSWVLTQPQGSTAT